MGNCFKDPEATPFGSDTKNESTEPSVIKYQIYEACIKKIKYINKYFDQTITAEQRKRLNAIQKILIQMNICSQKMGLSQQQQDICYGSINQELKKLKYNVQNVSKLPLTDYEAFSRKIERLKIHKIDLFEILSIPEQNKIAPTLQDLKNINFPILSYSNNNLIYLAGLIMKNTQFVAQEFIKSNRIDSFIQSMCLHYNITGYHNFSHGFSVFLMAYQSYNLSSELKEFINNSELFFLLIAALGHDLNHRGRNNAYYVKKKSQYALMYSNQGVLQNMHISTLFRIMDENPNGNLIQCLRDTTLKTRAKKMVIKSILATDMSTHFASLKQLSQKCQISEQSCTIMDSSSSYLSFKKQKQQDRDIIIQSVIHACDIGNPCLEYKNYLNWAILLTYEFNQQHRRESYYEYQLTPMLQYTDKANFYKGQIGFSRHFVLPLWKQLSVFSNALKIFPNQIEENIKKLQQQ